MHCCLSGRQDWAIFLLLGDFFTLGGVLQITAVAQNFWLLVLTVPVMR
jgi:hypothetical protein